MTDRTKRRRCLCGMTFKPVVANQRSCPGCAYAHRKGKRCDSPMPCATCERSFARLAEYNRKRKHEGADRDRRRGVNVVCPCGCGATLAGLRSGLSFGDARRDFIVIPEDKDGKRRHGRRNQVLGLMRMRKRQAWSAMVDEHLNAKGA